MSKAPDEPMTALDYANAAPRCGARSKRHGKPCKGPAMANGRCRFHGGLSTGPRTAEGLKRARKAPWRHGHYSAEAKAARAQGRQAARKLRELAAMARVALFMELLDAAGL